MEILTEFLRKLLEKFFEISGKLLGMNVAKTKKKFLMNFK